MHFRDRAGGRGPLGVSIFMAPVVAQSCRQIRTTSVAAGSFPTLAQLRTLNSSAKTEKTCASSPTNQRSVVVCLHATNVCTLYGQIASRAVLLTATSCGEEKPLRAAIDSLNWCLLGLKVYNPKLTCNLVKKILYGTKFD